MDAPPRQWFFDGFRLDARARTLHGPQGEPVALTAKALDVLIHLVAHADRVVGKDELLEAVWQGRVVEENTLTQAVSVLRKALGTGAGDHRYVVTVPGRGYRFVAELTTADDTDATNPTPVDDNAGRGRRLSPVMLVGVTLALLVALLLLRPSGQPDSAALPETDAESTLAVLPFRPVSGEEGDDLLALGMAETLITRLARHPRLRVRALASAERLAGSGDELLQAGVTLGARFVVDGSTQRSGQQIRVNVRLTAIPGGETLWANTFDTTAGEVFGAQDQIARDIVRALSLLPVDASPGAPCDGDDVEAYRAYLRGHHLIQSPSANGLRRALGEFRQAVDLDPTCARAWAGQAYAWRGLSITGDQPPLEVFPLARAAVQRALDLNPQLAEAYASLGFIHFWHDWDWVAAEAAFLRAIELNPSLAEARLSYAHLLSNLGRHEAALAQARQARELDPLSPLINVLESRFLRVAGRSAEARTQVEHALTIAPAFWSALMTRGTILMEAGEFDAAIADLERASALSGGATQADSVLATAYARAGRPQDAQALLDALEERAAEGYVPAFSRAAIHLALGSRDRALDLLEQAIAERDLRLTFLKIEPRWDELRDHPRFIAIMREVGLDDDQVQALVGGR
jgi:DNA-binding winged helix-turn-helix (wHTH) protein/TolB-like protein/tetratricopeptide (TPR) repeat protein